MAGQLFNGQSLTLTTPTACVCCGCGGCACKPEGGGPCRPIPDVLCQEFIGYNTCRTCQVLMNGAGGPYYQTWYLGMDLTYLTGAKVTITKVAGGNRWYGSNLTFTCPSGNAPNVVVGMACGHPYTLIGDNCGFPVHPYFVAQSCCPVPFSGRNYNPHSFVNVTDTFSARDGVAPYQARIVSCNPFRAEALIYEMTAPGYGSPVPPNVPGCTWGDAGPFIACGDDSGGATYGGGGLVCKIIWTEGNCIDTPGGFAAASSMTTTVAAAGRPQRDRAAESLALADTMPCPHRRGLLQVASSCCDAGGSVWGCGHPGVTNKRADGGVVLTPQRGVSLDDCRGCEFRPRLA